MQVSERTGLSFAAMLAVALAAGIGGCVPRAQAQEPIKIGIGIAQTGPLAGGGKAALLALRMWRDDVNAKGGLLGRQGGADRLRRPVHSGDHAGHLRQAARRRQGRLAHRSVRDRADRADHAARQAARPAADGQLRVSGEPQPAPRPVFQQRALERGRELVGRFLQAGQQCGRQDRGVPRGRPGVRAEPGERREGHRQEPRPDDRLRAELSARHGRLLVDDSGNPGGEAGHGVRDVLPEATRSRSSAP